MKTHHEKFDEHKVLHAIKHFLPAQAPLKDFVHHNTLHAFQHLPFFEGTQLASEVFGYKVSLSVDEYRKLFKQGKINEAILDRQALKFAGQQGFNELKLDLLSGEFHRSNSPRIGTLRSNWKTSYQIDLDARVHPLLFRTIGAYLDQGISMWKFPLSNGGFLASLADLERHNVSGYFKSKTVKALFLKGNLEIETLLERLVGDVAYFEHYLYDQQFGHQGWSGMVAMVEENPGTLTDRRKIELRELIIFEILLEMDALESHFGKHWKPLCEVAQHLPEPLFAPVPKRRVNELIQVWQESLERSWYDEVLAGIRERKQIPSITPQKTIPRSFQAVFCIDDRECSVRRHLENMEPQCETYGTAGFFGVEFYFKPQGGKFYDKLCPAPVYPKHLIIEIGEKGKLEKDAHFHSNTHGLFQGWLISQTLGFWSAFRLFLNIFRPAMSPATASSFKHMNKLSRLTVENQSLDHRENGLQIGFTIDEMVQRVENQLKSISLVEHFAPLVYIVSHGSSSVNNPYYAAYDCGACAGRPGSVNSRVFCEMANHPEVRAKLKLKGIDIPEKTRFVSALHDTCRDEIVFYDEEALSPTQTTLHQIYAESFDKALDRNARERSRKFELVDSNEKPERVHEKVKRRSVSLFEPRPELNHATNCLCIVGGRDLTRGVFLDRRAFLNSYNYQKDESGAYLLGILKAVAPVCGGINLEYFFSRVDNQKLGAGSKLPHNVMGLFGLANGIDGDLRPGLPMQMIEVHDPLRLMVVVEHFPSVLLSTLKESPETYEWFKNEWVNLVVLDPKSLKFYTFVNGDFEELEILHQDPVLLEDSSLIPLVSEDSLPVYLIS